MAPGEPKGRLRRTKRFLRPKLSSRQRPSAIHDTPQPPFRFALGLERAGGVENGEDFIRGEIEHGKLLTALQIDSHGNFSFRFNEPKIHSVLVRTSDVEYLFTSMLQKV